MASAAIMLQGTGSSVGKSMLVAGLCRLFADRGLTVRPFKPQNMSNNAAATADGGEIGRAQATQALACRVQPTVHMNPVLLKPESETGAQVVVQGRRLTTARARGYAKLKPQLLEKVLESFRLLSAEADLVIVEGAGSTAEVNLRAGDIANMGFAETADIPVVLAGDIDRGGVIAQIVGTHALIPEAERARIRGFLVNKFRGDPSLFDDGRDLIARRTGWPALGVVPWFAHADRLPAEDAMELAGRPRRREGAFRIAVPAFSRIANFDDLDPLAAEPGVDLEIVAAGRALPGDADLILLPGCKSTTGELRHLRAQGWDIDILAHARRGGRVLGLCGGYQMLGRTVADPEGVEGPAETVKGLGLLDVATVMTAEKRTVPVAGSHPASGAAVSGYEIHIGRTEGPDRSRPWLEVEGHPEGAASADGRVLGSYVHGLFGDDGFRRAFLAGLGAEADNTLVHASLVEQTLDELAAHLEAHLDIGAIARIAGL
ncbi:MAG: cobyric acid synthase CobQ [Rhizobiales bacterium NRL2]|jgi:adenosylcobyric acid synthase|nr:MAG: cobyric acid synthase CobQ [Rhizobiales bacterium NRL2]